MEKKLLLWTVVVIWLILSIAGASFAQVQNASLTGLVSDPSGAVINGASVTIRNNATNVTYIQKTDQSGYFLFPSLPIGAYTASVEFPGFKKAVQNQLVLAVGQSARTDFTLEVGGVTEVVEVQSVAV